MLFDIRDVTPHNFEAHALRLFQYQYDAVPVYKRYVDLIGVDAAAVRSLGDIPFLPISFFKSHNVIAAALVSEATFLSSTTTGNVPSKHHVANLDVYQMACVEGFQRVYGDIDDWCFLALLPSYLERGNSSLVWMVNEFMQRSRRPNNGFFLNDFDKLTETVFANERNGQKTMVIGVSYALLDWAERFNHLPKESFGQGSLKKTVVMETGGMKGRRRELIKEELHARLTKAFGVNAIHAEYGMTELLSQAYSTKSGLFRCPDWMKVVTREINDPLKLLPHGETGVINVVDLANQFSCAFIATEDLGITNADGSFSVLGRLDSSELRGCNLLVG